MKSRLLKPILFLAIALPACADLFVGPASNAADPVIADGGLVFKVTEPIQITALSAFANGGNLAGAVSVRLLDYHNQSLAQETVTGSSPVLNSVWATETLLTPLTLGPGTYALTGVGFSSGIDAGVTLRATYAGGSAVSAYDSYYGDNGTGTDGTAFAATGTEAFPEPGSGWIALGDPRLRVVNFDYTAVPEPESWVLSASLALGASAMIRRIRF